MFEIPKISVVMCTYNSEKYLKESIESILQQSFSSFELIIVDDGSTDSTIEILKSYQQDPRVNLFAFEENRGVIAARNYAISKSRGYYIAIMDHDDIANVDRLQVQYDYVISNNLDVCASFYVQMFNQTSEIRLSKQYVDDANLRALMTIYSPIADPTAIVKRDILGNQPYLNEDLYVQDYGLWSRLSIDGRKFGCCPENLLIYRVHSNQFSILNRELAGVAFKKIQQLYSKKLLNIDWVPHSMKFLDRVTDAFFYIKKLNQTIKNISFGVNYQIYSRFQYRGNGILTPFIRLERLIVASIATVIGRMH